MKVFSPPTKKLWRPSGQCLGRLHTIFGFVGLTDMTFVNAQPMKMGSELENKGVAEAKAVARKG